MANTVKGEVVVNVRGEARTLCLTMNGVINLADQFGQERVWKGFVGILAEGEEPQQALSWKEIRAIIHEAMREADPQATLAMAGKLMSAVGMLKIGDLWRALLVRAFDPGEDTDESPKAADERSPSPSVDSSIGESKPA